MRCDAMYFIFYIHPVLHTHAVPIQFCTPMQYPSSSAHSWSTHLVSHTTAAGHSTYSASLCYPHPALHIHVVPSQFCTLIQYPSSSAHSCSAHTVLHIHAILVQFCTFSLYPSRITFGKLWKPSLQTAMRILQMIWHVILYGIIISIHQSPTSFSEGTHRSMACMMFTRSVTTMNYSRNLIVNTCRPIKPLTNLYHALTL